jgi:hypothetical protein
MPLRFGPHVQALLRLTMRYLRDVRRLTSIVIALWLVAVGCGSDGDEATTGASSTASTNGSTGGSASAEAASEVLASEVLASEVLASEVLASRDKRAALAEPGGQAATSVPEAAPPVAWVVRRRPAARAQGADCRASVGERTAVATRAVAPTTASKACAGCGAAARRAVRIVSAVSSAARFSAWRIAVRVRWRHARWVARPAWRASSVARCPAPTSNATAAMRSANPAARPALRASSAARCPATAPAADRRARALNSTRRRAESVLSFPGARGRSFHGPAIDRHG